MSRSRTAAIPEKMYSAFLRLMPVACVDLLVMNARNEVLLVKRKNEPSKNEWWFPGGRIHKMELRKDAAVRKLHEECGLSGKIANEIGTYDVILDLKKRSTSHAVTTVYLVKVKGKNVKLDSQSSQYEWKTKAEWMNVLKPGFVKNILSKALTD